MTGGTLKSAPGFTPSIDSQFVGVGNDYIKADGDGKHVRLNAHGVVKYVMCDPNRSCAGYDADPAILNSRTHDGAVCLITIRLIISACYAWLTSFFTADLRQLRWRRRLGTARNSRIHRCR